MDKSYPYQDPKTRTIGFALEDKAKKNLNKVFLYFEDKKITYETMNTNANRIANGFRNLGVEKDEGGYLFFAERKKDAIRRRGENISSQEVKEILDMHPKVLKSAVVGVASDLSEEEVMAFVKIREGEILKPEELLDFCQERMAYFMVPRYVEFIDLFPLTPTDKIEKYKLKQKGVSASTWDREKANYILKR
jgi:acyl-CoA synthetase (AMP-forming)/AMP-acid ligase II